jgi:hypothetical protein
MTNASAHEKLDAALLHHQPSRLNVRSELNRLQAVANAGAPEAVVFYAARILEGLAADAVERLTLEPSASVYSNLHLLDHFDLFTTPIRYWSHSLRRLGNASRHLHHEITECDSHLAALFAEVWIDWFLSRILKQPSAFRDRSSAMTVLEGQMRFLASQLEHADQHGDDMNRIASLSLHSMFWSSPVFSSTLAEILIQKGANIHDHADNVLSTSLRRFAKIKKSATLARIRESARRLAIARHKAASLKKAIDNWPTRKAAPSANPATLRAGARSARVD